MLRVITGRERTFARELIRRIGACPNGKHFVVVPKQMTLAVERMLLDGLHLNGSFDMNVVSPARLCQRIFQDAGQPTGTRVDELGRVMLTRNAIRAAEKHLTIYRRAQHYRGFPERAANQIAHFRQARLSPEALREVSAQFSPRAAMKLNDLSYILEAYGELTEGIHLDGEAQFLSAVDRLSDAKSLRGAQVWFYGFDMVPPTMYDFVAGLAAVADETILFMPLMEGTPDETVFRPMRTALDRLTGCCKRADVQTVVECAQTDADDDRPAALTALEEQLFARPFTPFEGQTDCVHLSLYRNADDECRRAAALVRELVRTEQIPLGEILILTSDPEAYAQPLKSAFEEYGIPLFLSSPRAVARHLLPECLLTALTCVEKNYPLNEMLALMYTGFLCSDKREIGAFANYAVNQSLHGRAFLRPLDRGTTEEVARFEPLREKIVAPLQHLAENLKAANTLTMQLTAIFDFLTEIDAYKTSLARQQALIDAGMRAQAGEESQVWNRMLETLDQMNALMGEKSLSRTELRETLREALSAVKLKQLPQSEDAVYVQSSKTQVCRSARIMLLLGASESSTKENEELLDSMQREKLCQLTHTYLGPDETDLSLLRRFYLKNAFGQATQRVYISCPLMNPSGGEQQPGSLFDEIRNVFPQLSVRSVLEGEEEDARMLRAAPSAAARYAARSMAACASGTEMRKEDEDALYALCTLDKDQRDPLLRPVICAVRRDLASDRLKMSTAQALYKGLRKESVTRLEKFASCPYRYFVQFGLQPERVRLKEFDYADEGNFLHDAVKTFMAQSMNDIHTLSDDEADARMNAITKRQLERWKSIAILSDDQVAISMCDDLCQTAQSCARALTAHMRGSAFRTVALERDFGPEDGQSALSLDGNAVLEGRIDRIDEGGAYVRVIDYKRSKHLFDLDHVWHGLDLQLPLYMAVEMRRRGASPAAMLFFQLSDGIVEEQSTDENVVEDARTKAYRMEGLLNSDESVIAAMTPDAVNVLNVSTNTNGTIKHNHRFAEETLLRALCDHSLRKAAEFHEAVRSGEAKAAPYRLGERNGCQYCDFKNACPFDRKLDGNSVRRLKKVGNKDFWLKLQEEEWNEATEPLNPEGV